jgi:hypothetical protein
MIPSTPLRIDLILAKVPQAVQPGLENANVCSDAASGPASARSSTRAARRPKLVFRFIMKPPSKVPELVAPSSSDGALFP